MEETERDKSAVLPEQDEFDFDPREQERREAADFNDEGRPFNPADIDIEEKVITVYSLLERIKNGEIVLAPEFQRQENLWTPFYQSQLIESMIIGIPLPVFYFAVAENTIDENGAKRAHWLIVDGLQRLCAIRNFILGDLRLEHLQYLKKLSGCRFNQLPNSLQRTLLEVNLNANIIRQSTPSPVMLNIFQRLNRGGLPLSDQEMRHAMHPKASCFLKELADTDEFKRATKNQIKAKRMGEREYVNRFLAFDLLGVDAYDGMGGFLDKALKWLDHELSVDCSEAQIRLAEIDRTFKASLDTLVKIAGEDVFVVSKPRVNKALFEVLAVSVARLTDAGRGALLEQRENFKVEYATALVDTSSDALRDLVSASTGVRSRVEKRYALVEALLERITGEKTNWRQPRYA